MRTSASTARWTELLRALLAAVALTAVLPATARALPPSLTVDQAFSPPTGIARDGGAGTGTDIPGGIAVFGDRIYVAGESNGEVAVIARRSDGTYDGGFGGDGRVDVAVGVGKDVGQSIVVLPDGRLRILAASDADDTSSTNNDIAVIGLNADGSFDGTFGGGDGKVRFPVGVIDDAPSRMIADAEGRLAITGWRKDANGKEDGFVAMLNADGSPLTAFDGDGIRTLDRAGGSLNDRGIDIAWRPGGGVVIVMQVATNADTNVNNYVAVLHAFTATGADDTSFAGDGDLELGVGEPNTIPGGMIAYGGRLWITGSTKAGQDTDSFLARVGMDGSGLTSRRFDMRGAQIAAGQTVVSGGGDLDVLPGLTPALVVVGSTTYNSRTYWSAAVFDDLEGDLDAAEFGDLLVPTDEYGALLGVAAGDGWLATTGSLLNVNGNFDTSFGTLKLLVDADKRCDLAIGVPRPLEGRFEGSRAMPVTVTVANKGTRACAGTISVPAQYALGAGALSTGVLRPGAVFSTDSSLAYLGARQRDDTVDFQVTVAGDADATNNSVPLHVLFDYCDAHLRAPARALMPNEGSRRFALDVRNAGTATCGGVRVSAGAQGRAARAHAAYDLAAARSVDDEVSARLRGRLKVGAIARIVFRVSAQEDVDATNDAAAVDVTVVGVGDSRVSRAGRRVIAGRASGGRGKLGKRARRVRAVHVAVRRLGKGCRWLASKKSLRWRRGGKRCGPAAWLRTRGKRSWRLKLRRALPRGRYVVYSRTTIAAGFREGRFSKRDRNRVAFRVGR
ncbi:MAG TPA: hypothetical protein VFG79_24960 [Solirubrobacter sp.]|nr:hypothetical protein [Solirubrobacter sp.]